MRRGRIFLGGASLLAALSFGTAGAALAATPQDMCNDIKDGKVDGTYTAAEWTAFFNDPTVQGYGCGGVVVTPPGGEVLTPPVPIAPPVPQVTPPALAPVTAGVAGVQKTATPKAEVLGAQSPNQSAAAPLATTKTSGTLPFTGAELGLFALVGLALVGSGLLLRTTAKHRGES
jgi:hypothetical protein